MEPSYGAASAHCEQFEIEAPARAPDAPCRRTARRCAGAALVLALASAVLGSAGEGVRALLGGGRASLAALSDARLEPLGSVGLAARDGGPGEQPTDASSTADATATTTTTSATTTTTTSSSSSSSSHGANDGADGYRAPSTGAQDDDDEAADASSGAASTVTEGSDSTTTWTSTSVSAPDGAATYTLTLSIPAPYGVSSQGYYETPHVVEPHKPTNLSASYSQKDTGDASYVWTIDGVVVPALPSPRLTHRFVTTGAHTVNVTRTDSERTLHAVVSVFSRCARTRAPRRGARRGADAAPRAAAPPPPPLRSLSKGTCGASSAR